MDKFRKEVEFLFGKEILVRARELNLSRFNDKQIELIGQTLETLLNKNDDREQQVRFVEGLNLETSLLLCSWFIRGGQHLYRENISL